MPVYTVGSVKGGVGKTTVATHFAILLAHTKGEDVLLVDADWQENASDFTALRAQTLGDPGYTCIRLAGMQVKTQVRRLREKYTSIVIDAGGKDSISQRAAISVSDVLLAPFVPRSFDLWAIDPLLEIIDDTLPTNENLRTFFFLNKGDPFGTENVDAYAYVHEKIDGRSDAVLLRENLGTRKAFAHSASSGLSVTELKPRNPEAEQELTDLFASIQRNLNRNLHVNRQKANA